MPNWCENTVVIQGSEKDQKFMLLTRKLSRLINSKANIFQAFVPRPKEEDDNWYDWNCTNWGCKWDINDYIDFEECDSDAIKLRFDTAWSPPSAFLKTLAKKYPSIHFRMRSTEPGVGFEYLLEIRDGEVTFEESRDYWEL